MSATAMIHVRVDEKIKKKAAAELASMGLSVSDVVRMLLVRVVAEHAIPFSVRSPNAVTAAARQELKKGNGKRFKNVKALMDDLNADD